MVAIAMPMGDESVVESTSTVDGFTDSISSINKHFPPE